MKNNLQPPQFVLLLIMFLFLGSFAPPARAIIHRHDVPDEEFLLPDDSYPAVFDVTPGNGVATLIAPQWAITAAHVTTLVPDDEPFSVTIQDQEYHVLETFVHPEWVGDPLRNDIGLIHLSEPVIGIDPLPLYTATDEVKQVATLVGRGDSGNGLDGATARDGLLRAATNEVDFIESDTMLAFVFDNPDPEQRTFLESQPTALEGVSGPGDSGGPALFSVSGVDTIAGISAFGAEIGDQLPGTYGTLDFYTRVSIYADWVDETLELASSDDVEAATVADSATVTKESSETSEAIATAADPELAVEPESPRIESNNGGGETEKSRLGIYPYVLALGAFLAAGMIWRHRHKSAA